MISLRLGIHTSTKLQGGNNLPMSSTGGDKEGRTEMTTATGDVVLKSEIRPLDVLMGRGNFQHPGNARFLRIVSERKTEYVSASTNSDKDRIAAEVMERVADVTFRTGIEDGFGEYYDANSVKDDAMKLTARFLVPLEDDNAPSSFQIMEGKALAAKVKMNLRQKPRSRNSTRKKDATPREGAGRMTATTICSGKNNDKNKGKRQVDSTAHADSEGGESGQLTNLLANALLLNSSVDGETIMLEEGGVDMEDLLFQDFGNPDDLERDLQDVRALEAADTSAGSDGHVDAIANGMKGPAAFGHGPAVGGDTFAGTHRSPSFSRQKQDVESRKISPASASVHQQLLDNVRFALGRAQKLTAEHKAAAMAGEPRTSGTAAVQNSLRAFGRDLCVFLTGTEPPAIKSELEVVGSAYNDELLSGQKPRKRPVNSVGLQDGSPSPSLSASTSPGLSHSLADKLRDAGVPVSLCTVVTSLLDAADPNEPERYRSADEVEADLGRMASNPDRYLFDPPMDRHSGKLFFVPNRLYGRTEEWEKVKSAFDKIIVSQEETHGYLLISGPPGR